MERNQINLKQYKKHEKKFPWALIRKIIVVALMFGLLFYLSRTVMSKPDPKSNEIKIQIED
jgi:hypothetical protein